MLSNLLIACSIWLTPAAQTRTLGLDLQRSDIAFTIDHMGFLTVEGTFSEFQASLKLNNGRISQIEGEIMVASINTEAPARDETLIGPGYLDADNFSSISFSSRSAHRSYSEIAGRLKIKSEVREVFIPYQMKPEASEIIFMAEVVIKRSEFNLDFGAMNSLIGDEIKVSVRLVFTD